MKAREFNNHYLCISDSGISLIFRTGEDVMGRYHCMIIYFFLPFPGQTILFSLVVRTLD